MTIYIIIGYLAIINIVAFAMYGADKHKAQNKAWRTPEATLIGVAAIGGSIGAFVGMKVFRHKTKHPKFTIGVPLILILHIILGAAALYYFMGR